MSPCFVQVTYNLTTIDKTSYSIVALDLRPDCRAIVSMGTLCSLSLSWKAHSIFLIGYGLQLYWQYPMQTFFERISSHRPRDVGKMHLLDICVELEKIYARKRCRAQHGVLCLGPGPGLSALKNPTERRSGLVRFRKLSREVDLWKITADKLWALLRRGRRVPLKLIIDELMKADLKSYGDPGYGLYRSVRAIHIVTGSKHADTIEDWYVWRAMSTHLKRVTKAKGLWEYSNAILWRDALRRHFRRPHYSLSDLTCFICLLWPEKEI